MAQQPTAFDSLLSLADRIKDVQAEDKKAGSEGEDSLKEQQEQIKEPKIKPLHRQYTLDDLKKNLPPRQLRQTSFTFAGTDIQIKLEDLNSPFETLRIECTDHKLPLPQKLKHANAVFKGISVQDHITIFYNQHGEAVIKVKTPNKQIEKNIGCVLRFEINAQSLKKPLVIDQRDLRGNVVVLGGPDNLTVSYTGQEPYPEEKTAAEDQIAAANSQAAMISQMNIQASDSIKWKTGKDEEGKEKVIGLHEED